MAPVDNTVTDSKVEGFEFICSLTSNDIIPVHKYRSKNTGLTIFIAEVDGPVVGGYFCLATEAFDDDGLPHTLEHLIFLGSEQYPYRGVLDLLANRCLASGTNACTDVDNTFYTMETVGSEGFLTLLPVYLDHILYPTLKDSAYTTEIHHITGEGEDGGVVYFEMQERENVGEFLVHQELRRAIYPGKCGYKSNTGGALKNLRESTSNQKVKDYHQNYYRPENLCVIITGQVKHENVFKALWPIEEKIMKMGKRSQFERPWQNEIPPFTENVERNVFYPCNDETNGLVCVGWRGPSTVSHRIDMLGCMLLLKYLTDTSASPLQKEFVEIEGSFASDVKFSLSENSESLLYIIFQNVPKTKIPKISSKLMNFLKDIYKKGIDMQRMETVVNRHILETLSNLESSPHDAVAYMIIGDFLFGNDKNDLDDRLNEIKILKTLTSKPEAYWLGLLKKYLTDAPSAVMKGIPSVIKLQELSEAEQNRVEEVKKKLGPQGLSLKEKELDEAVLENDTAIPDEIISSVPIPDTESIKFHQLTSYVTNGEQHPKFNVDKLPFFTYLDNINTNFVYMFVVMDTSDITLEKKPYLPVLLESLLESPVLRDGVLIPYETIVSELEMDTIAVSTRLGVEESSRFSCGSYSQSAILVLQVEVDKYDKGVKWINDLLYNTRLTAERLKIISTKIINDVAQMKRKGKKLVDDLLKSLIYKKESNHYNVSMLRQQQFLTKMLEKLGDDREKEKVLEELESVKNILTNPKNMVLFLTAQVDRLLQHVADPYKSWSNFSNTDSSLKQKLQVVPEYTLMKTPEEMECNGCVTGIGCVESAFLSQCAPSINSYLDPDSAPLLVCLQYFTQLEGPLWKTIRGLGYAYSYDIFVKPNQGLIYLTYFGSTNIIAAYRETKKVIFNSLAENKQDKWDELLFQSAKSSLIYEIVQREKSVGDMVLKSVLSHFKNIPQDFNRQMIRNISSVNIKDMHRIASTYLKPLFDPNVCKTTVICHPTKAAEVVKAFKNHNHDLKLFDTLEETWLNSW
ncbi:hypothetical protein TKK_0018181 [Trichogramma kaykai]